MSLIIVFLVFYISCVLYIIYHTGVYIICGIALVVSVFVIAWCCCGQSAKSSAGYGARAGRSYASGYDSD